MPGAKDERSPLKRRGFCYSSDTPIGKASGVGYVEGMGVVSGGVLLPRQLALGEGKGQKKGRAEPKPRPVSPGRPRREVDVELLRELRDRGYGFKRTAKEYTRATGEYISHTTVRVRLVDG